MTYRFCFDVVLPLLRVLFPSTIPPPYGSNPDRTMLLVQVKAAAVNPVDAKFLYGDKFPYFLRTIKRFLEGRVCGIDVAGLVLEADPSSPFKAGDEVFGTVPPALGSYAEVVRVPSDFVYHKPSNLTFVEAAAVPLVGLTITQIFDDQRLESGMRLCVLGASGGTGHVAVQLGRHLGLSVTAVCGKSNRLFVESLGADDVVTYDEGEGDVVEKLGKLCGEKGKFDAVFDAVSSHDPRDHSAHYERRIRERELLNGTYVIIGGLKDDWIKAHVRRFLGINLFEKGRILHWVRFPMATKYLKQL
jgi:NADPH:quinone reductase-like Zn-dependent oxidoreductase